MEKRFFSAVIDVKESYGTLKEIEKNKDVSFDRYFNNKFVDSPEKALAVACDVLNQRNHNVSMNDIMESVTFDQETSEYTVSKLFTDKYNPPTEKQLKRFFNKEKDFRLIQCEYKIQVFETQLITNNLIEKAKKLKFPQNSK